MITFITGWAYSIGKLQLNGAGLTGQGGLFTSPWGQWITLGASFGTIMWFNVWFVIWPNQKKIITWTKKGEAPPEMANLVAQAGKRSRINTYLSVPLLFCMGAASHYPSFDPISVIVVLAAGFAIAWHFIYKVGPKAGANF